MRYCHMTSFARSLPVGETFHPLINPDAAIRTPTDLGEICTDFHRYRSQRLGASRASNAMNREDHPSDCREEIDQRRVCQKFGGWRRSHHHLKRREGNKCDQNDSPYSTPDVVPNRHGIPSATFGHLLVEAYAAMGALENIVDCAGIDPEGGATQGPRAVRTRRAVQIGDQHGDAGNTEDKDTPRDLRLEMRSRQPNSKQDGDTTNEGPGPSTLQVTADRHGSLSRWHLLIQADAAVWTGVQPRQSFVSRTRDDFRKTLATPRASCRPKYREHYAEDDHACATRQVPAVDSDLRQDLICGASHQEENPKRDGNSPSQTHTLRAVLSDGHRQSSYRLCATGATEPETGTGYGI
jgi:hypothetical protein